MIEIEGKQSGHKLRVSPETLRLIGPLAAYVPDIAGGDVIILRLSDIMRRLSEEETRRNTPLNPQPDAGPLTKMPPPDILPEQPSDILKELLGHSVEKRDEFLEDSKEFADINGFDESTLLNFNLISLYEYLNDDAAYASYETKHPETKEPIRIIVIPDKPNDDETRQNLIINLSENPSIRLKDRDLFDLYTANAFSLFHEVGHFRTRTPSGIVNETMADRLAKETLEKLAEGGDKKIHLKTLETLTDLRSIGAFHSLSPDAIEQSHMHFHSTGILSGESYPEMLGEEARHIETLKHLNGFVSSLIGGALRPAADMIMKERNDPEDLESYHKNWRNGFGFSAPEKILIGTDHVLGILAQSHNLHLSVAPAIVELKAAMARNRTQSPEIYNAGNMRLGHAFVQQNPGIHYAFIKGIYDAGLFEGDHPVDTDLQKRYVERFLEAFERVAEITPEERALAKDLTEEMKKTGIALSGILPGTPDRLHPPDRKPETPEDPALKTAPPQP